MNNTKSFSKFLAVSLMVGAVGCSKGGFNTNSSPTQNSNQTGQGSFQQPIPQSIDVSGSISTGSYAGEKAIDIDRTKKLLILRVPLGQNPFVTISNGEIPKYPGASYATELDVSGTAYLVLRVPLKYILHGVNGVDPVHLPNGENLPGVPSGEPPVLGLAINLDNNVKLYVYLGADFVGVYVETPFDIGDPGFPLPTLTVPIKNQAKTEVVGYFSLVFPKQNNTIPGGFFMSFQMPPQLAALLDKYVL